jgi:CitMHS family citrate-Mg2+:H+ or citrate-Ca2+:H+ symporter
MLAWLGLATIVGVLALILGRVTSVVVALTLVPIAAALAGGFGVEIGRFAIEGMTAVAPVAALLAFAVVYFGVMNDAGLFDPAIRAVVRRVGRDPVRIAVGTAAIASIAHLDGAGASTFMVTVPAMLPLYQRAGMSPLSLAAITALAAGTMNMLPWGGPTSRAAVALQTSPADVFLPLVPAMCAGIATVFACATWIGRQERARMDECQDFRGVTLQEDSPEVRLKPDTTDRPRLWWFNAVLTTATLVALFVDVVPAAVVFLVATAMAVLVNTPDAVAQRERLTAHGSAAMLMVTTVFAAGLFTGVLKGSGMLDAVAHGLVASLPDWSLGHLPIVLGLTSMPLSLAFDPDSFYFGVLPVVAQASQGAGGSAVEVGRAAVLGQMTTGFPVSPLTPATFLLVGLAGVDFGDHQRRTIPYAFAITVVMTAVAVATRAIAL